MTAKAGLDHVAGHGVIGQVEHHRAVRETTNKIEQPTTRIGRNRRATAMGSTIQCPLTVSETPGLTQFVDSLAQLEAQIAAADAAGEAVPPEARHVMVKLRELVAALSDLASSFDKPRDSDDPPPATQTR